MIQLEALLIVAAVVALAAGWIRLRKRATLAMAAAATGAPYIIYFSGDGCGICRTHQEPALGQLQGVRVEKVDALAEPEMARKYRVYTLPTTVVVDADGRPRHVNYGYAPAARLRRQIECE